MQPIANYMARAKYVIAVLSAALATVAYFVLQPSPLLGPITDWMFALASGICSLLAFLVIRRWGYQGRFGAVHTGMFLGIFLWFLGDTAWAVYGTFFQVAIPYPSFADVFYLSAYVPIVVGVIQFLRIFRHSLSRERAITALVVGLLTLGLTSVLLIGPLLLSSEDILTKFFDLAYPVLDSVLVVLVFFMLFAFRGGKMEKSWIWIAFGLLLNAAADILFSLGTLQGWYYSGHPIELVQLWSYISLGLGFYEQIGFYDQLRP